ncbi:hypothetical protein M405DRAFT_861084 [Rhizopogon salebrosus TDB-379]|nr:hypothetical protein M405DRAFT_861084 [Rhizopogon salebrosus TDB-379]
MFFVRSPQHVEVEVMPVLDNKGLQIVLGSSSSRLPPLSAARKDCATTRTPSGSHGFFRDLVSSLSRRSESAVHGRPSSSRPLIFPRDLFSGRLLRRDQPDTEIIERKPIAVEVPCTRGKARNVRVGGKSKEVPTANNIMTIQVAGPSQPPNSSPAHQSSEDASSQQSSSQLANNAMSAAAAATTTSVTATPSRFGSDAVVIRQVGCWTRFWLLLGCISTEMHQ